MPNFESSFPYPPIDDRPVYDVSATKHALPTLAIAVEIGLFEFLMDQRRTIENIAAQLPVTPRAAEAIVSVVAALGFLAANEDGRFDLTQVARTYLLQESPFFRNGLARYDAPEMDQLRRAIVTSDDPVQPFAVKMGELPDDEVQSFIGIMHAMTLPAASCLAEQSVFRGMRRMLDVAGGSGSLCLAIASRHPDIRCTLMDLEPVGRIAEEHIEDYGLQSRVKVSCGDMFHDPWPSDFDGVLFGNVFHDWDLPSCRFLARQAYEALNPGGAICLHEMLLNERKDGPLTVACFSIAMLLHEKGKQFTADEVEEILTDVGFTDFQAIPTFGYYSLLTGIKP